MTELIKLPPQNATVVGAFNPAIFQPDWLQAHVPGLEGPIALLLAGPPSGPPLLRFGEIYIQITPQRLMVYGIPSRIGRIAGAILMTLPHTPLQAAGLNFLFEGRRQPESCGPWAIGAEQAGIRRLLHGEPEGLSLSQAVGRDDGVRLTVKLSWPSAEPDLLLELNYNRDAPARPGEERAKVLADHVERAVEFEVDAQQIRNQILGG